MPLLCLLILLLFAPLSYAQVAGLGKSALHPMDPREWFGNYQNYNQANRRLHESSDPVEHFRLGQWAWKHGLEDEAWEQWILAIQIDPDHAASRQAMGFVEKNGRWSRPGAVNREWIGKVDREGRAYSFTIAIEDDAEAAFFEEFSWRIRRLNWFIWDLTEGQVYLKEITIADKTSRGRFVIEKDKLKLTLLDGGGAICYNAGRSDWVVKSGGRCYVRIFCHEFFHGIFGLPDERHGCACLMQGGLYGIKTNQISMCDVETHVDDYATPTPCWTIIQDRFPKMIHPNPAPYGKAPEVKIVIENN